MDVKTKIEKEDKKLNFSKIINRAKRYWWVYAVCLAGTLALAAIYIRIKPEVYGIDASIILNDDDDSGSGTIGGLGSLMASFNMGGPGRKFIEDEERRLTSHSALTELVKKLHLNETYTSKENLFATKTIYFEDSPVSVYIPSAVLDTIRRTTVFKIDVPAGGKNIKIKVKQGKKTVYNATVPTLPVNVRTPRGNFRVSFTRYYDKGSELHLKAILSNPKIAVDNLNGDLSVGARTKKTSVLDIGYKDANIERGKAVVNTLIDIYNQRSLDDYQAQARRSVEFIEDRLQRLYSDLETSEQKIQDYKKANRIVDATAEAEYIFKTKQNVESGIIEYRTKASVLKMIIDFLGSESNKYSLIPFAADMPSDAVTEYNKLVLDRLRLLNNAKGNNTALKMATAQVDAMRSNLMTSLEKELTAANIAISDMNRVNAGSNSRIGQMPEMEKDLLSLYRDQKIKNQIYAFLLQKLEENQMKLSRESATGKIIDEAYETIEPIEPKKPLIIAGALIFGVIAGYVCVNLLVLILNRRKRAKAER